MKLSDKKSIQQLVIAVAALGLREIIICPGSRNAPLTISFNRHPAFHCTSIRDERSAAFFALGKSLELHQPVAIVCTSGSAALNFAPAIAEAFYQRIPLLVFTADRPVEWTDQGDGQTIRQTNVYANFIRKSYDLYGDAQTGDELWFNARCLSEGFSIATQTNPGPVHFNIPLKEPLYNLGLMTAEKPRVFYTASAPKSLEALEIQKLRDEFLNSEKVMILVGQHLPSTDLELELKKLAHFENTIILCESTSNVHDENFIENIDRCITTMPEKEAVDYMPDLLITIGGAVVSKRIKALLRKYKPARHWNIHEHDAFMDTYQSLTCPVFMEASAFFKQFAADAESTESTYKQLWLQRDHQLTKLHEEFCREVDYSDFFVFNEIYKRIKDNIEVHLANSSPIRYAQLFDNSHVKSSWSNRGTSGIDGCTSTAMGAAIASPEKEFLLITGDVAFYYDNNALWNDVQPANLKIILINNGGGGIFRIIAGPGATDELEEFFETSQQKSAGKMAAFYEWNYLCARDEDELNTALEQFFRPQSNRTILEIFTPQLENAQVLNNYWKFLKEKYII